ncbi:hypothetical protein EPA93_00555 [Ktedonosporobacter rubrisoli]|uniref:Uncharacterized protein n=1 Tax=Ktedonosporobacter rubrisoli TaxID=2509675 RepID=A0A4P6JI29_KTERU|nr:hypothetical protein [Ktedonosporobacter rubrisoli]QBD74562.1 hypothetical protein EPA93_00555 [Ktedonosporobacter rubrisoli]
MQTTLKDLNNETFQLIHPLFDAPEEKCSPEGLGPMHMRISVKLSLFMLRAYLILMGLLVLYSILHQAGVFGH